MEFYDVIRTKRSVRKFKNDAIPEEVLNRVLDAARIAPSGHNTQPWRYVIVKDPDLRKRMVPACNNQEKVAEAPVLIVACGHKLSLDKGRKRNIGGYVGEMSFLLDMAIGFTYLTLAARVEGLGTCWIGAFNNTEVKKLVGVPERYEVAALTPIGYPADSNAFREPGPRKTMDEIVAVNKFKWQKPPQ